MTRDDFLQGYCERAGIALDWLFPGVVKWFDDHVVVAVPCSCNEQGCEGWAAIQCEHCRETSILLHQIGFYGPTEVTWEHGRQMAEGSGE